jgi:adenosylmethionine-8-amino-7-oxononanoate aminotransferase
VDATVLGRSARYNFLTEHRAPFEVARSEGCYLITPEGRRILDAAGGAIVVSIGHGRKEVAEAAARALEETAYVVPPFATESRVRLVERLRDRWLPVGLTRIIFASGGSEAMDMAIRLARQHHLSAGRPRRWRVLGRELSYHGTTLASLSVGGHKKRRKGFEPWLLDELTDQPRAPAHYCLRCPLDKTYPECQVACADALEQPRWPTPTPARHSGPTPWWAPTPGRWCRPTSTCPASPRSASVTASC